MENFLNILIPALMVSLFMSFVFYRNNPDRNFWACFSGALIGSMLYFFIIK